jgi:hypothetical protein
VGRIRAEAEGTVGTRPKFSDSDEKRLGRGESTLPALACEVVVSGVKTRLSASDQPEALAARQREHRLRVRVRPKLPVDSRADPWLIAEEALDALDRLRTPVLYGARENSRDEDFDLVAERIRRLCWGPEDL